MFALIHLEFDSFHASGSNDFLRIQSPFHQSSFQQNDVQAFGHTQAYTHTYPPCCFNDTLDSKAEYSTPNTLFYAGLMVKVFCLNK